jgi:hypothetical protein
MDPNQDRAVQAAFDGRIPAKEDQLRDNTTADRLRQAVLGDATEAAVVMHEAADENERLRAALKRIANHPDARDSIVSIAAAELDEQIAASE